MKEMQVEIPTKAGRMGTFVCHPERGGPFAPIIIYMDAPGMREELRDFARRLGTAGYAVLLPDLYYRTPAFVPIDTSKLTPDSPERMRMSEQIKTIDIPKIMDDTEGMLKYIDGQPQLKKRPIGCVGYCMSGQYAVHAAARYPGRVTAAASIYGVRLMTDQPDSPHLAARQTEAELYFACAEVDHWVPLEQIDALRASLKAADVDAEVELYPGVEHGFAFPARPAYNKAAAERHWTRLFALFRRRLG